MDINDAIDRTESNPVAEILEIVRRRVLKERMAEDERDGCVLIDWLDGTLTWR